VPASEPKIKVDIVNVRLPREEVRYLKQHPRVGCANIMKKDPMDSGLWPGYHSGDEGVQDFPDGYGIPENTDDESDDDDGLW
jgi:hypothetical protein